MFQRIMSVKGIVTSIVVTLLSTSLVSATWAQEKWKASYNKHLNEQNFTLSIELFGTTNQDAFTLSPHIDISRIRVSLHNASASRGNHNPQQPGTSHSRVCNDPMHKIKQDNEHMSFDFRFCQETCTVEFDLSSWRVIFDERENPIPPAIQLKNVTIDCFSSSQSNVVIANVVIADDIDVIFRKQK